MKPILIPVGQASLLCCLVTLSSPLHAQSQSPSSTLDTVTVTGNPLAASDLIAPATILSGENLLLKRQGSLGETLDGLPGVSSTYFGPVASRPTVRGLDGDRIRILNNGGASADASGLSFDHAVPIDPLTIERVEVLRGPGALQYGGSAVGGVVNVINSRIQPEASFDGKGGDHGSRGIARRWC
jgi:iron complex outermembrane receptor protein